jgi:hypothetical protein
MIHNITLSEKKAQKHFGTSYQLSGLSMEVLLRTFNEDTLYVVTNIHSAVLKLN